MAVTVRVSPNPIAPGDVLDVICSGLQSSMKAMAVTVDPNGVESGWDVATRLPTNINRPMRGGGWSFGIKAPPLAGTCRVRIYVAGAVVGEATFTTVYRRVMPVALPT